LLRATSWAVTTPTSSLKLMLVLRKGDHRVVQPRGKSPSCNCPAALVNCCYDFFFLSFLFPLMLWKGDHRVVQPRGKCSSCNCLAAPVYHCHILYFLFLLCCGKKATGWCSQEVSALLAIVLLPCVLLSCFVSCRFIFFLCCGLRTITLSGPIACPFRLHTACGV